MSASNNYYNDGIRENKINKSTSDLVPDTNSNSNQISNKSKQNKSKQNANQSLMPKNKQSKNGKNFHSLQIHAK